jgi:hypothetical protein
MFTWICPQCGREVPPAYNECPDCAKKAADTAANPPVQPANAPPPPMQPAAPQYAPPQYAAPPYAAPPNYPPQPPAPPAWYPPQPARPRGLNLPVWLMTIVFALAIGGLVGGVYWILQTNRGPGSAGPAPSATVESPAAKPGAKTNPVQKYIEVTGVRFTQDAKKKTIARFVVVNHSEAEISGLAGNVTIWGRTKKSEEDAQGTFSFSTTLGPFESKELSAPINTKLKIYELPDWQNITTDIQVTAPAGGA